MINPVYKQAAEIAKTDPARAYEMIEKTASRLDTLNKVIHL